MIAAEGIGLSANQIGLNTRVFVARVENKFYAVFNPEIIQESKEKNKMDEGCLSIPGVYGLVERPAKVTLKGYDANGRPIKIKAWGLLARVFQHEVDHLNGNLFIDKAKQVERIPPIK
jgi:peptide deformylase